MTAEQLLRECRDRLMPYDSKLRERIDAYLSTPAPPPDIAPEAEIARLRSALKTAITQWDFNHRLHKHEGKTETVHPFCPDCAAIDAARKETK